MRGALVMTKGCTCSNTQEPYVTHRERCSLNIGRVLTAESLLQAPELHGCSVRRESNVVQVS